MSLSVILLTNTDKVSIVALIKTPAAPAWSDIIVGPCGDVIFTLQNHKLNFAGQCAQPIPHDTWSTTLLNDDEWHHLWQALMMGKNCKSLC